MESTLTGSARFGGRWKRVSCCSSLRQSILLSAAPARASGTRVATTTTYGYSYDDAGRLTTVTRDGSPIATYRYDANGNRLSKTTPTGTETATYDAQDRLLSYGGTTYTWTANGALESETDATGTTHYVYDALGNLRSVTLPDGTLIEYVIDGQNRRIGKKVNGTLVRGWLYADQLHIIAQLDGTGTVISRFVYGTRTNVPDYMIRGGTTYRIVTDHLGSPRLIVDTATGTAAQSIGYDEFGNMLTDSASGFQSFGFAGGLYDADTKLVQFGARDYDPETGYWTATDPINFGGGSSNLYSYAFSDPVNYFDGSGLLTLPVVGNVNAGEKFGAIAVDHYADTLTDPKSAWYDKLGAAVGGFFAALWTPCTSDKTFLTLSLAYGADTYVSRPFWQYYPANNPGYRSAWLTRGAGWKQPYSLGDEAVQQLALPPYNPATAVRQVPSSWNRFIGGPGTVAPAYGQPGGGIQYFVGGWPQ
jgi:RHS repeat-associated protein